MADHNHAADAPAMDYPEHERTYEGFVNMAKWGTIFVTAIMVGMAVFLV